MAEKSSGAATDFIKSDYDKAVILDNPHVDNLMSSVMSISAELWVLRRRMLISEKLAEQKVFPTAAAIDAYRPTPEETKAWEQERNSFIQTTLGSLTRPSVHRLEAVAHPAKTNSAPLRNA